MLFRKAKSSYFEEFFWAALKGKSNKSLDSFNMDHNIDQIH